MASALGGAPRVTYKGDVVFIRDAQRPVGPNSLNVDLATVREAAEVNPSAAIALLLFHPDYAPEEGNLLQGRLAIPSAPTAETVDLMIQHADEYAMVESMRKLEPGTFIDVRWRANEVDDETLRIAIESELTDIETLLGKGLVDPTLFVLVGKYPPRVLSTWYE